jgi:hypothetical protein
VTEPSVSIVIAVIGLIQGIDPLPDFKGRYPCSQGPNPTITTLTAIRTISTSQMRQEAKGTRPHRRLQTRIPLKPCVFVALDSKSNEPIGLKPCVSAIQASG